MIKTFFSKKKNPNLKTVLQFSEENQEYHLLMSRVVRKLGT